MVAVADVYAAGEAPIETINAEALVSAIGAKARRLVSFEDLPGLVRETAQPGDLVVCLGAGDITIYANALPARLEAA